MGNAGEARLDVVALARDEVSVVMNKISGELDQMKAKLAGYEKAQRGTGAAATDAAKATSGLVTQMTSLKGQAAGVNKVRESFENLRSNALFVVGGVTAVVGVFKALADQFDLNAKAIAQWEQEQKGVNATLDTTKATLIDIDVALGRRKERTELDLVAERAEQQWEKTKLAVTAAENAVNAYVTKLNEGYKAAEGSLRDYSKLEDKLAEAMTAKNKALEDEVRLRSDVLLLMGRQVIEQQKLLNAFVGPSPDAAPNDANTFVGPSPSLAPDKKPPGGGGGSRSRPTPQLHNTAASWDAFLDGLIAEAAEVPAGDTTGGTTGDRVTGGAGGTAGALKRSTTDAEKLAEALTNVADATLLVAQAMPEYGAALSEIQTITDAVVAGKLSLNDALIAGGAAIAANAAKAVGGVRAEAAARAIYEYYMGFATLSNPVISGGHFIAAAGLTAFAAGAGGGGGGKSSGTGGGRAANTNTGGQGGGTTTVVNNFSMGIGDRQTIRQSIRLSERSSRGTGADTRAAV